MATYMAQTTTTYMADGLKHKAKNPLGQKAGSFKYSLCHRFALTKMVLVGLNLNTRNMPRNLGDVPNLTNRFGLGRTSTPLANQKETYDNFTINGFRPTLVIIY